MNLSTDLDGTAMSYVQARREIKRLKWRVEIHRDEPRGTKKIVGRGIWPLPTLIHSLRDHARGSNIEIKMAMQMIVNG